MNTDNKNNNETATDTFDALYQDTKERVAGPVMLSCANNVLKALEYVVYADEPKSNDDIMDDVIGALTADIKDSKRRYAESEDETERKLINILHAVQLGTLPIALDACMALLRVIRGVSPNKEIGRSLMVLEAAQALVREVAGEMLGASDDDTEEAAEDDADDNDNNNN